MTRARHGFTLIEVGISLMLITIGVLSVMAILPSGIRVQTLARDRIISAALALYAMDMAYNETLPKWMRTPSPVFRDLKDFRLQRIPDTMTASGTDGSGPGASAYSDGSKPPRPFPLNANPTLGESGGGYTMDPNLEFPHNNFSMRNYHILLPDPVVHAPDLENQISNWHHGVLPVPPVIAARLDSDNDEIAQVLADGGQLYFFGKPAAMYGDARPVPPMVQRLVFAVIGAPQRNAQMFFMDSYFPGYQPFTGTGGLFTDVTPNPVEYVVSGTTVRHPPIELEVSHLAPNPPAAPALPATPYPLQPYAPYAVIPASSPSSAQALVHFAPEERCRQIVFWAVDWFGYEDTETTAIADYDRYRYPVFDHRNPVPSAPNYGQRDQATEPPDLHDHLLRPPTRFFHYGGNVMNDQASGSDIPVPVGSQIWQESWFARRIAMGGDGADFNGNRRQDRGPTAPSVRMRAVTVARYNYYDPRVWLTLNLNLPPDE